LAPAAGSCLAMPGLCLQELLCVVFEPEKGPHIQCSDPVSVIGDTFSKFGRHILPEQELSGTVVSYPLDDIVILGTPVYIEDIFYARNCFQFNICMVISSRVDQEVYRAVAPHLAKSFRALEIEHKLISKNELDAEGGSAIQSILAKLRYQLNRSDYCFVPEPHCISFKIRQWPPILTPAPDKAKVLVPVVDLEILRTAVSTDADGAPPSDRPALSYEFDPTLLPVTQFIDGIRSVQEIIEASNMEESDVNRLLRHLLHFGWVKAIDAIDFKCRYSPSPNFHKAFNRDNEEELMQLAKYVSIVNEPMFTPELIDEIGALYSEMGSFQNASLTLGAFQRSHAEALEKHKISLRHLVTYGLLRGFLELSEQPLTQAQQDELASVKEDESRRQSEDYPPTFQP